jgi:hypothetical protein
VRKLEKVPNQEDVVATDGFAHLPKDFFPMSSLKNHCKKILGK